MHDEYEEFEDGEELVPEDMIEEEVVAKAGVINLLHPGTYVIQVPDGMRAKVIMENTDE